MRKMFCTLIIVISLCSAAFADSAKVSSVMKFDSSLQDEAGNEWNLHGAPSISVKEYITGGASLFLNGESYLQAKNTEAFNFPGEFTMEAWIYPEAWVTDHYGGATFTVFSRWLHGIKTLYVVNIDKAEDGNGRLSFYSDFRGAVSVAGKTPIPLNTWTHIAVTRDSEKIVRVFVNGKMDGMARIELDFSSGDYPMTIGASSNAMRKSAGYIDDWCVYKSCLWTGDFVLSERPSESGNFRRASGNFECPCQCCCVDSPADEIRKFKGLLDDGIITQEEFDAKKKILLGM